MAFSIQIRDMHGKWKPVRYVGEVATADEAWKKVAGYDIDNLITSEYRVVDENKKAVSRPAMDTYAR